MSIYLDASVLVALFTEEPQTERADTFLRKRSAKLVVSDLAEAEFASAIARRIRMNQATRDAARQTFAIFDAWVARETEPAPTTTADIMGAAAFIRRLDLTLRAPDAIHIAIVQRIGADLFTFDKQMAKSARALGTGVIKA